MDSDSPDVPTPPSAVPPPASATGTKAHCAACQLIDALDGIEDGTLGGYDRLATHKDRTLFRMMLRAQGKAADKITDFAGSMKFIYIHLIWFGLWIAVNVGLAGLGHEFDKFPFGLLTLVVSLEAIFLATFVMISQNRQAARTDVRTQLDFENNIRSEIWSIHIGHALGINTAHVEETVSQVIAASLKHLNAEK